LQHIVHVILQWQLGEVSTRPSPYATTYLYPFKTGIQLKEFSARALSRILYVSIAQRDLKSLLTPILSYLDRCRPQRGPSRPSEADPLITARLVNIDKLIGPKRRQLIHAIVPQVCITALSYPTARFLRPADRLQRSADRMGGHGYFELIPQV
jgi:hypothetical protein